MAAAYRGTVDDHGESSQWHDLEARATVNDHYGTVIWPASLVMAVAGGRELVATSIVTVYRGSPLLAFLLVEPSWQGRGAGTQLLRRSAATLVSQGCTEWTLAVTDGNPAQRLYERSGFVVDESLRSRPD